MTPQQHYEAAEEYLRWANNSSSDESAASYLRWALVHATLATVQQKEEPDHA